MIQILSKAALQALLFDSELLTVIEVGKGVVVLHKIDHDNFVVDLWQEYDETNEPVSLIVSQKNEADLQEYLIQKKRENGQRILEILSKKEKLQ